ncbi:MAG: hypothetical protein F6K17_28900, partial [Okeania sp. SIO3C4]|nr:hypothetical protein [Okeania sp. SIO3C4]
MPNNIEVNPDKKPEDRELNMRLSPAFAERLEKAIRSGRQDDIQRGIRLGLLLGKRRGYLEMIKNLLVFRFGELDSKLEIIAEEIMELED